MSKVVQRFDGRVYINFTESGCGFGCTYCFIPRKGYSQILLPREMIFNEIRDLIMSGIICGRIGIVFVLASETEAFVSGKSTDTVNQLLAMLLPLGNPIQIATKSKVPESTIQTIRSLRRYDSQVLIYISVTTISSWKALEPGSVDPESRFKNFPELKRWAIPSCLLIKPFTIHTETDLLEFQNYIASFQPDYVCIGARYSRGAVGFRHPLHAGMHSPGITPEMRAFSEQLYLTHGLRAFHNASCVIAKENGVVPTSRIWSDFPHLCIGCMNCRYLYSEVDHRKRSVFYGIEE